MEKHYRRLQRISTIPILAAFLLSANPGAAIDPSLSDVARSDSSTDTSIQMPDVSDSRLREK